MVYMYNLPRRNSSVWCEKSYGLLHAHWDRDERDREERELKERERLKTHWLIEVVGTIVLVSESSVR